MVDEPGKGVGTGVLVGVGVGVGVPPGVDVSPSSGTIGAAVLKK